MTWDSLKYAVEGISGGASTIIIDDRDLPSIMNVFSKRTNAQLFGGSNKVHSAWIVNDTEKEKFYFSKYINTVIDGRAYSLANVIPAHTLDFESAMNCCTQKGSGWHLASLAEWAAIVHLMHKSGYNARGNNNHGANYTFSTEHGNSDSDGLTSTGSGPAAWNHDGSLGGISDFVGNVGKWLSGMRIIDGEINVMTGNTPSTHASHEINSDSWRAIMPDGTLVAPKTDGVYYYTSSGIISTTHSDGILSDGFTTISGDNLPEIINELLLCPVEGINYSGIIEAALDGERMPIRGGSYLDRANAGAAALFLNQSRSYKNTSVGFFSAYQV